MRIAVTLMAHGDTECVRDTVESIRRFATDKILLLVDGAAWEGWGKDVDLPVYKMSGFYHNFPKSPYRNITLGLMNTVKVFPDVDWYCYTEYDTLFASSAFKEDLERADKDGVWCMGNDARTGNIQLPIIENMLKTKINGSKYLLGCCIFHHRDYLHKLQELDFFNRFLYLTNDFTRGYFPGYEEQGGYDLAEHLYPTLANHFGGKVRGQAYFEDAWHGNYKRYPLRWKPDIDPTTENFPEASIIHPLKQYDHPIRQEQRKKRNG